jgi:hypothetical protein
MPVRAVSCKRACGRIYSKNVEPADIVKGMIIRWAWRDEPLRNLVVSLGMYQVLLVFG